MAEARHGPLGTLRTRVAERGWRATLAKAFGDHVFRRSDSVVMEGRLDRMGRAANPLSEGRFTHLIVRPGDALPPLCAWLAPRADDFRAMLADGKVGLLTLREGVTVGCAWLSLTDHRDARTRERYPVKPGEAYQYCWLVDPAERRRGAALASARFAFVAFQTLGIRRPFGVVDRANRASYKVLHHFGYRECGTLVRHIYLFRRCWTLIRSYRGTLGLYDPRPGRRAGQAT